MSYDLPICLTRIPPVGPTCPILSHIDPPHPTPPLEDRTDDHGYTLNIFFHMTGFLLHVSFKPLETGFFVATI